MSLFFISVGMLFHARAPEYDKLLLNMFNSGFVGAVLLATLFIAFALFTNNISNVKRLNF